MTTTFVSRHEGALAWVSTKGVEADRVVSHLDPDDVEVGDIVIGTLPVNLASEVCRRGARYLHLSLQIPPEFRGVELTAEQMDRFGATLEEYRVHRIE